MGILDKLTGKDASAAEAAKRQATATQTPTTQELEEKERDTQYRKEQAELLKKNRMPTAQERLAEAAKRATIGAAQNIREKNIQRQMPQQKGGRPLTREEVERIARRAQRTTPKGQMGGKMTGGQFHAPMFGPNIPSGGVGKKMNFDMGSALDFPGFGGTHGKKTGGKKFNMDSWFKF